MTVIETARWRLRELRAGDLASLGSLFTDPHVMRHYPSLRDPRTAPRWQRAVRKLYADYGYAPWTLELPDGSFMGQCGPLPQIIDGTFEIEIICFLLRPFWRGAYADEATLASIQYAFERIDVARVVGLIFPENRPSVRLAHRCGLTFERLVEQYGETMALYARAR